MFCVRLMGFAVFALAFVLYLVFCPLLNKSLYMDQVLLQREKLTTLKIPFPASYEEVSFKNQKGDTLCGVFFGDPRAKRIILMHHGSHGNLNYHARGFGYLLEDHNNAVFMYDYSGYGKSTGTPTLGGLAQDGRAAYDYLVNERHIAPKHIVNYGISLGTGVATAVAAQAPCAGLVLFAPYTSITNAAKDRLLFLRLYPDWLITDEDLNSLANIKKVNVPIFIAHGALDQTLLVRNSDQLFAAAQGRKEYMRMPDAGHCFTKDFQKQRMARFIATL